jgi:flavin reductase (DIM6/NTAB) family NADH-FMN oxidoreductase RutF
MNLNTAKDALQRLGYGLYVVGTRHGENAVAVVANWVTQVSFRPLMMAAAMELESKMRTYIERAAYFSVNVLPAGGTTIARDFLKGPEGGAGKVGGRNYQLSLHGMPFLNDAAAAIECRIDSSVQQGDHIVFFGEVTDARIFSAGTGVLTLQETGWKYSK